VLLIGVASAEAFGHWETRWNFCEASFDFFALHPLAMTLAAAALVIVIQKWCERRFSQLEIF
jgi:hypothetical protein